MKEIEEKLKAPFKAGVIHWRIGSTNKKSQQKKDPNAKATSGMPLIYINARDVMKRLDEVVGIDNWKDNYRETPSGRVFCELSINLGGEWITKTDAAGDTQVEGEKGAVSDAFKRAAVKFGIGRYLYYIPPFWIDLVNGFAPKDINKICFPYLPDWALPQKPMSESQ